ncbi:hypothetical protein [Gluconobacter oxydans]|uniref:hypothetical protein n=1 Tax=Gluconobacter oxydans TaxID=442 RepID=UPI0039EC7EB3
MIENLSVESDAPQSDHPTGIPETTLVEGSEIDRNAIRRSRKLAAKKAKRMIKQRFDDVSQARPINSQPADQILKAAVDLYADGFIARCDLKAAIAKLEAIVRRNLPDVAVTRAPRTLSQKPERVGLMVHETRAIMENSEKIVTVENHSVVLEERRLIFISGLLPGGSRPHLFERVFERDRRQKTLAEIVLLSANIWPTLMWMRTEQRLAGRGSPITVMMTPFADGLMFGSLEKLVAMPPAGPNVAIVDQLGSKPYQLNDFYGDANGSRLYAKTTTYVDAALLSLEQRTLRDMLQEFVSTFSDVVADNNWRWKIGLGLHDPAVTTITETFKLKEVSADRRAKALAALELIVCSTAWQNVAAATLESQQRGKS